MLYIYIYDISRLRIKDLHSATYIYVVRRLRVKRRLSKNICIYRIDERANCTSHTPFLEADGRLRPIHTWHAVPMPRPCRAAKGLECVFPIWCTQCGRVWFTLAKPRPCHVLTMPFFSRPLHRAAVERRPVDYLHAFGFFWLPRGVPRRLLSEAYQSSSQRSIPTTVKSGSSTLQKRRSVKLLD